MHTRDGSEVCIRQTSCANATPNAVSTVATIVSYAGPLPAYTSIADVVTMAQLMAISPNPTATAAPARGNQSLAVLQMSHCGTRKKRGTMHTRVAIGGANCWRVARAKAPAQRAAHPIEGGLVVAVIAQHVLCFCLISVCLLRLSPIHLILQMTTSDLLSRSDALTHLASADPFEIWKEVKDEPFFAVSSKGTVFSLKTNKVVVPRMRGKCAQVRFAGRGVAPWTLVLEAFHGGLHSDSLPFLQQCSATFRSIQSDGEEWKCTAAGLMIVISSRGRIYSVRKDRLIKPNIDPQGYWHTFCTWNERRGNHLTHLLVAKTFLPRKDARQTEVDHIDGNPANNDVSNLRWATPTQNSHNKRRSVGLEWPGAFHTPKGNWAARIVVPGGRTKCLGTFVSQIHASLTYLLEAERLHGEFFHPELRILLDTNRHLVPEIVKIKRWGDRSGLKKGVQRRGSSFTVQFTVGGKVMRFGTFSTAEAAGEAAERAEADIQASKRRRISSSTEEGGERDG